MVRQRTLFAIIPMDGMSIIRRRKRIILAYFLALLKKA